MKQLPSRDVESLVSVLREKVYAYCDVEGLKARLISTLLGPIPPKTAEPEAPGARGNGTAKVSSHQAGGDETWFSYEDLRRLGLTRRETEDLGLVASGNANQEIASLLYISPLTVRKHLEHIYEKLGVDSRTGAVARVLEFSRFLDRMPG